jgi:hypothetical protein
LHGVRSRAASGKPAGKNDGARELTLELVVAVVEDL